MDSNWAWIIKDFATIQIFNFKGTLFWITLIFCIAAIQIRSPRIIAHRVEPSVLSLRPPNKYGGTWWPICYLTRTNVYTNDHKTRVTSFCQGRTSIYVNFGGGGHGYDHSNWRPRKSRKRRKTVERTIMEK